MYKFLMFSLITVSYSVFAAHQSSIEIDHIHPDGIQVIETIRIAGEDYHVSSVSRWPDGRVCEVNCFDFEDGTRVYLHGGTRHKELSLTGRVLEFSAIFAALPNQLRK